MNDDSTVENIKWVKLKRKKYFEILQKFHTLDLEVLLQEVESFCFF